MAVLAADIIVHTIGTPIKISLSANAADTYYKGAMVFIDADGGCQVVPEAGDRFVGLSCKNQVVTAAAQEVEVYCWGLFWVPVGTDIAAADEGELLIQDIDATQSDNIADCVSATDATEAENDQIIGFKIAYATRSRRLYSWLGGVLPDHRRRGVGKALMDFQHAWAKERGYLNVETGTIRNNVPMMMLNFRCGFEIIGTYARGGKTRVLLAKRL